MSIPFVVSGPSGTGKSTLLGRLLHELPGLRFSVSHTTRAPRPGEADGIQYHFVRRATFEAHLAADGFLEWAEVYGNLYGTSRDEWAAAERDGVDLVLDIDVQGARQVRAKLKEAVSVFILPPSFAVLEGRLTGRASEDAVALGRRVAAAGRELLAWAEYDHAIVNREVEAAVADLEAVVRAARCRTARVESQVREVLATFPPESGGTSR